MKNSLLCTKIISIIGLTAVVLCGCSLDNKSNIEVATETINEADTETTTKIIETTTQENTTEASTTDEEAEVTTKSYAERLQEIKNLGFTDEEAESIAQDAGLYMSNGVDRETAYENAINSALKNKETLQEETEESTTNEVELTETSEVEKKPYDDLPLTLDTVDDNTGCLVKVYGDREYFVIIEKDGTIHEYTNSSEARECLKQIYHNSDEYIYGPMNKVTGKSMYDGLSDSAIESLKWNIEFYGVDSIVYREDGELWYCERDGIYDPLPGTEMVAADNDIIGKPYANLPETSKQTDDYRRCTFITYGGRIEDGAVYYVIIEENGKYHEFDNISDASELLWNFYWERYPEAEWVVDTMEVRQSAYEIAVREEEIREAETDPDRKVYGVDYIIQ